MIENKKTVVTLVTLMSVEIEMPEVCIAYYPSSLVTDIKYDKIKTKTTKHKNFKNI